MSGKHPGYKKYSDESHFAPQNKEEDPAQYAGHCSLQRQSHFAPQNKEDRK